jgi:hypothetical protein
MAGEGDWRANDPSPAMRGRVPERSEGGQGCAQPGRDAPLPYSATTGLSPRRTIAFAFSRSVWKTT